ncbi:MAG: sulfurtransferase TusA family protein [Candidatus Saganbacteria bacterium]|nr:sulfurtransferase TusA family protein [Candidatus Saganbacteria bacterium]
MENIKVDQKIDLRGVSCPLNFVKTKLKLEEMQRGQVLEVILDDGEAIQNVPRSIKEEGHKILVVARIDQKYFRVVIERGEES